MASTTYRLGRDSWLVVPDETLEALKPDLTPPPPSPLQLAIERRLQRDDKQREFSAWLLGMSLEYGDWLEREERLREERARMGDD